MEGRCPCLLYNDSCRGHPFLSLNKISLFLNASSTLLLMVNVNPLKALSCPASSGIIYAEYAQIPWMCSRWFIKDASMQICVAHGCIISTGHRTRDGGSFILRHVTCQTYNPKKFLDFCVYFGIMQPMADVWVTPFMPAGCCWMGEHFSG